MPAHCAAYGCTQRRTAETKKRGITFHRFPRDAELRREWELAVRRKCFSANKESVLCSQHFEEDEFDRTGQICRIRTGVVPSVFNFPPHLKRLKTKTTRTFKPQESREAPPTKTPPPNSDLEHNYSLPRSPSALKERFTKAAARLQILEKEKRNARVRERRAKTTVKALLEVLQENNLLTTELWDRLDTYSDLPFHLFKKRKQNEYSAEQRQFATSLHLQGPKAYSFLRDTLPLPLPHPRSLQRWISSLDKPSQHGEAECVGEETALPCVSDAIAQDATDASMPVGKAASGSDESEAAIEALLVG